MPATRTGDAEASTSRDSSKKGPGNQAPIPFIKGPSMDWSMNDGLYSRYKTWKLECEIILDSAYCHVTADCKVNTLLRWSGQFGMQKFQSWGIERKDLTLDFMWTVFEAGLQ